MFIRYKHLSRRTMIRSASSCIALPFLDAMVPNSAFGVDNIPSSIIIMHYPHGNIISGKQVDISEYTKNHSSDLCLIKNIVNTAGTHVEKGRGGGGHPLAAAPYLTGSHIVPGVNKTTISIDQILAKKNSGKTPFSSLELGMEGPGSKDGGFSGTMINLSWGDSSPRFPERNPKTLFNNLFAGSTKKKSMQGQDISRKNLLDISLSSFKSLRKELGKNDQIKLDQHIAAIGDLQTRLLGAKTPPPNCPKNPTAPGPSLQYPEILQSFFDLLILAVECDLTRVITFSFGNELSGLKFQGIIPGLDARDQRWHKISHYGGNNNVENQRSIIKYMGMQFGNFLDKVKSQSSEGSMLDRTLITFGSGHADSNRHTKEDLPLLVASRHSVFKKDQILLKPKTEVADVWLGIAKVMGFDDVVTLGQYGKKPIDFS